MTLINVKTFRNRTLAETAQDVLKQKGIHAVLQCPDFGVFGAGGVGFYNAELYVAEPEAARAKRILDKTFPCGGATA